MTATAIPTFHLTSANKARSMSDEELMLSLVKSFKPLPKTKREAIKGIMKLIKVDETYAAMALQVAARISQRGDLYGVWGGDQIWADGWVFVYAFGEMGLTRDTGIFSIPTPLDEDC